MLRLQIQLPLNISRFLEETLRSILKPTPTNIKLKFAWKTHMPAVARAQRINSLLTS